MYALVETESSPVVVTQTHGPSAVDILVTPPANRTTNVDIYMLRNSSYSICSSVIRHQLSQSTTSTTLTSLQDINNKQTRLSKPTSHTMCVYQQKIEYSCGCSVGGEFLGQCLAMMRLYIGTKRYDVCRDTTPVMHLTTLCPRCEAASPKVTGGKGKGKL